MLNSGLNDATACGGRLHECEGGAKQQGLESKCGEERYEGGNHQSKETKRRVHFRLRLSYDRENGTRKAIFRLLIKRRLAVPAETPVVEHGPRRVSGDTTPPVRCGSIEIEPR